MRRLNLNRKRAMAYLHKFADDLSQHDFSVTLSKDYDVGNGFNTNFRVKKPVVVVGVNDLAGKGRYDFSKVEDLNFVQALVTLYHEHDHYLQNFGSDKDLNCMISEVSVYGNQTYYLNNWNALPHEIHAEAMGVSHAWDSMRRAFPDVADECMLEYVNYRAARTKYMIPPKCQRPHG